MATFPGFQVPKPVEGIVAGITPNIDALELNQDGAHGFDPSWRLAVVAGMTPY